MSVSVWWAVVVCGCVCVTSLVPLYLYYVNASLTRKVITIHFT